MVAGQRAVGAVRAILLGYGLDGDAATDAIRMFRAAVHGFVALEAAGGFGLPRDTDRSFGEMIAGLDRAYLSWENR
ncbi:TetR-like C-terminal domain-containing protein [Micromonospora sp. BRA006-A]|nr:TetR-like C-terminal domain-containing protein [Micromonospora sp. BRA006-A]